MTEINVEDFGITLKEVSQMFEDVTREYLAAIDKKVNLSKVVKTLGALNLRITIYISYSVFTLWS